MTTRDSAWPDGTPCWVDLAADDFDRAVAFYSELFGWEIERGGEEFAGYSSARKDGRSVAGIMPKMAPEAPSVWTTYLASRDAEATMAKVIANGGQTMAPAMDVGTLGRMAIGVDAGGAVFGVWQGGEHIGFELANEPGSVTWNEQFSRAWDESKRFYTTVFGWEYDDMSADGFEYAVCKVAGQPVGGVGVLGEGMESLPPYWNTYLKVADVDQTITDLERLGGSVRQPPWDTAFGRMAVITDDQGVVFSIMADLPG
jgi:uncharacterized protein